LCVATSGTTSSAMCMSSTLMKETPRKLLLEFAIVIMEVVLLSANCHPSPISVKLAAANMMRTVAIVVVIATLCTSRSPRVIFVTLSSSGPTRFTSNWGMLILVMSGAIVMVDQEVQHEQVVVVAVVEEAAGVTAVIVATVMTEAAMTVGHATLVVVGIDSMIVTESGRGTPVMIEEEIVSVTISDPELICRHTIPKVREDLANSMAAVGLPSFSIK